MLQQEISQDCAAVVDSNCTSRICRCENIGSKPSSTLPSAHLDVDLEEIDQVDAFGRRVVGAALHVALDPRSGSRCSRCPARTYWKSGSTHKDLTCTRSDLSLNPIEVEMDARLRRQPAAQRRECIRVLPISNACSSASKGTPSRACADQVPTLAPTSNSMRKDNGASRSNNARSRHSR